MTDTAVDFDVIVVGGGVAGICCAGELLLQGLRPLLVVETKEVASNLRSEWLNGNRIPVQAATIHPLHTGGWWLPLAKALKVPIGPMGSQSLLAFSLWPDTTVKPLHLWYHSAESLFSVFEVLSPIPLHDIREEVLKVLTAGLAIPFDELADMDAMLWHDWLAEHTSNEIVTFLFDTVITLLNQYPDTTWMSATTVFGAWGVLRVVIGGEGYYPEVIPDVREGVFIPMAKAIEEQGGTIWRGCKVARIDASSGRVRTVVLEDGREVTGSAIAIATGNERIAKLVDPVPPEVSRITASEFGEHAIMGYYKLSLLGREVIPADYNCWHVVLSIDPADPPLAYSVMYPGHTRVAAEDTEPGKQTLVSMVFRSKAEVEAAGGKEILYKKMRDVEDRFFPEMRDVVEAEKTLERGGMWYSQVLKTDKLPRRSESVEALWYVGHGSTPIRGIYTEAAASAGILGAREIAATLGG